MSDGVEDWLDVLGCPDCQGALRLIDDKALHCPACGHRFLLRGGVPSLVRRKDVMMLAEFSRRYREARLREGWRPLTPQQALALPYGSPPRYPALYWEVRRQSYEALMRLLSREGPPPEAGPVADLGAGTSWLAHRLARSGYRVLALEASLDGDFGLGAAEVYRASAPTRFLPIQGDLEHPPLQRERLGLAIFNASLHYAQDLEGTLHRTARALRPGGCLVVLDTPIAGCPRPGSDLGDRHLGRRELQKALVAAGLRPRWIPVRRGVRWWVYQAKLRLKRGAPFLFPMVVGYHKGQSL
ncbi:MAG: methyltransferase domain-containing protein [Anaerolineae bacterium]